MKKLTQKSKFWKTLKIMVVLQFFVLLSIYSCKVIAQGICTPPSFVINKLQGYVVYKFEGKEEPVENSKIEVYKASDKYAENLITSTVTNIDGYFALDNIPDGKYLLVTRHSAFVHFYVRIKITKNHLLGKSLIVYPGSDVLKPCGGGAANLSSTKPKYVSSVRQRWVKPMSINLSTGN